MATIPNGYPSSTNTGVPAGTQLKVYTGPLTITKDGTVIDGMIINGGLKILADNVVIKNSQINYNGWWGIDGSGAKNLVVQDNTITGPGYGGDSNAAIAGSGTFLRNNISKSENGIVLDGGASTVVGNYIHDLQDGSSDPHYDGISVQGGQNNVLIQGNTVDARDTSAIFIKNDFGPISNVKVIGNYLTGDAGYQIYVDGRASGGAITNVQITGNYIEKGYYGYTSFEASSPVYSGNVQLAAGQLPPALSGSSGSSTSSPSAPAPAAPVTPSEPAAPSKVAVVKVPGVPGDSDGGSSVGGGAVSGNVQKAAVVKVPGALGDSDSGPSLGGVGVPGNVQKVAVSTGNPSSIGNVSSSANVGDVIKVGGHTGGNVSTSSGNVSKASAVFDGNVVIKNVASGGFQFNGLTNSSNLDRVVDHVGSGVQASKAGLISAYASSLFDTGDSGSGGPGHGFDGIGGSSLKMNISHDTFHIL